jgi:hypothetical protein
VQSNLPYIIAIMQETFCAPESQVQLKAEGLKTGTRHERVCELKGENSSASARNINKMVSNVNISNASSTGVAIAIQIK